MLVVGCLLAGVSLLGSRLRAKPQRLSVAEVLEALFDQGTLEAVTCSLSPFLSGICWLPYLPGLHVLGVLEVLYYRRRWQT